MGPSVRATGFSRLLASLSLLSTCVDGDSGGGRENKAVSATVSADGLVVTSAAGESFCNATQVSACANVSLGHLGSEAERITECRRYVAEGNGPGQKHFCWFLNDQGKCDSARGMCQCREGPARRASSVSGYAYPECPAYIMSFPAPPTPRPTASPTPSPTFS